MGVLAALLVLTYATLAQGMNDIPCRRVRRSPHMHGPSAPEMPKHGRKHENNIGTIIIMGK